jgi:hypothetical protein
VNRAQLRALASGLIELGNIVFGASAVALLRKLVDGVDTR